MNQLDFAVITDLEAAKAIWNRFSPHQEIDDEWDFRHAFCAPLRLSVHFIVALVKHEPVGLLPLQFNPGTGLIPASFPYRANFFEFFGGDDTDSNRLWTLPGYEWVTPHLLAQLDRPTVLAPLAGPVEAPGQVAQEYTAKYTANLRGLANFRDYLTGALDGSSRSKHIQQLNRLYRSHQIEVVTGSPKDLPLLAKLNIHRFGPASSFIHEYRQDIFRHLAQLYDTDIFKLAVDGEIRAVAFALIYQGAYLAMNIGYDYEIRDLGKLAVGVEFDRAIELGCSIYDCGKGEGGWKEQLHLTRIPQYLLALP